ncbi:LytTR family DNA-binding domain-containing protein [Spirosoma luteolum]
MLSQLRTCWSRPVAEDFRFRTQWWQSVQGGLYVFGFLYLFGGTYARHPDRLFLLALFGLTCAASTLVANGVIPALFPALYDEDRWTVGRQVGQVLLVLLCISLGNQLTLALLHQPAPPFWQMYISVTLIGFFPICLNVFMTEQRRLKRTLAQAQALNQQLIHRTDSPPVAAPPPPAADPAPSPTTLLRFESDTGKDRLALHPDQLRYIESVGNYIELHWYNGASLETSVLRSTLRDTEQLLAPYPQFMRCHRAFVVNVAAVRQADGNARGYQLTLADTPRRIPVSRTYLDTFDARFDALTVPS